MAIYRVTGVITEYVEQFIEADSAEEALDDLDMYENLIHIDECYKADDVQEVTPEELKEYFKTRDWLDEGVIQHRKEAE